MGGDSELRPQDHRAALSGLGRPRPLRQRAGRGPRGARWPPMCAAASPCPTPATTFRRSSPQPSSLSSRASPTNWEFDRPTFRRSPKSGRPFAKPATTSPRIVLLSNHERLSLRTSARPAAGSGWTGKQPAHRGRHSNQIFSPCPCPAPSLYTDGAHRSLYLVQRRSGAFVIMRNCDSFHQLQHHRQH